MAGHMTLDHGIGVRIPAPQLHKNGRRTVLMTVFDLVSYIFNC